MNWNDEDIATAKEGFGKHGKDFAAISRLFANKTEQQIKHFYQNYKKKHNLDQLIVDGKKKKVGFDCFADALSTFEWMFVD